MNKDWNYAHMWDTMRRALEESAREGLEVTPMDVLSAGRTGRTAAAGTRRAGKAPDPGNANNV